jgi:Arc/MetJ family transcription regulator
MESALETLQKPYTALAKVVAMERVAFRSGARSKAIGRERITTMNELNALERKSVNRRLVMAGFAGVGAAALIGSKLTGAQAASNNDDSEDDDMLNPEQEAALVALYEVFLASVSAELGTTDTATVDLAIRNGLKAVVDKRLADGDISANSATDRKAAIDAAAVPICIHAGEWDDDRRRFGGSSDDSSDSDSGSDDSEDDSSNDDSSDDDVTPTPKP